jgi:hypothetical protein
MFTNRLFITNTANVTISCSHFCVGCQEFWIIMGLWEFWINLNNKNWSSKGKTFSNKIVFQLDYEHSGSSTKTHIKWSIRCPWLCIFIELNCPYWSTDKFQGIHISSRGWRSHTQHPIFKFTLLWASRGASSLESLGILLERRCQEKASPLLDLPYDHYIFSQILQIQVLDDLQVVATHTRWMLRSCTSASASR